MHCSREYGSIVARRLFAVMAVSVLLLSADRFGVARGQENKPIRSTTRVYDIRDLLMQRRAYPAQSALVPPTRLGEARPAVEAAPTTRPTGASSEVAEEIISLIQETVDPDSWRENGGNVGAIRELQGQLIVTQTPENQEQLTNLLSQFRETSARMVTIRAHWIFLKPAELRSIAKPLAEDPALFGVDLDAVEKLAPAKHFQGQVTCFNTQTVNVTSGDARTVVWGMVSNTGGGANSVAYDPQASIVQGGMLLEVTPVLTPDARTVMADVQSVVSDWTSLDGDPRGGNATTRPTRLVSPTTPEIDRVRMNVQQLRTSVALPVGKPILIGGMTFTPSSATAGTRDDSQLYLVIEAGALANAAEQKPKK